MQYDGLRIRKCFEYLEKYKKSIQEIELLFCSFRTFSVCAVLNCRCSNSAGSYPSDYDYKINTIQFSIR